MKWQSVDGCGISDVLVMAQHRFQAQHFCLPCQPLRLKVCLCPSISSAFSLGPQKKVKPWVYRSVQWVATNYTEEGEEKNPLNLCVAVRPRQDTRFVLCPSSTGWVSLRDVHTVTCWGPLAPKFFRTSSSQWLVWASIAQEPPPWSRVCVTSGCKEGFGNTELPCLIKCVIF